MNPFLSLETCTQGISSGFARTVRTPRRINGKIVAAMIQRIGTFPPRRYSSRAFYPGCPAPAPAARHDQGHESLSENSRKEIFLALVDAQDHELDVAQSRQLVGQHFGISESVIRQIEREGMDRQWPPL